MRRWWRNRGLAGAAVCAAAVWACADRRADPDAPAEAAGAPRPNLVLLLTDDQAASTLPHMPTLQQELARQGTTFENFYLGNPLCCPARVSLLTGRSYANHGLEWDAEGCATRFFREGLHRRTLVTRLSEAGYRTGIVGKYLNDHNAYVRNVGPADEGDHLLRGWDDYHVLTQRRYYDISLHENGAVYEQPKHVHQTDRLAALATSFIFQAVLDEVPFLLYVATGAPHQVMVPAERHRDRFPDAHAPRSPAFDEADVSDKRATAHLARLTPEQIAGLDGVYRDSLRGLLGVDELLGEIFASLERLGQLERTYVFFGSDNGYHFGEHRIALGKGTPFEESVRFPLLVRGPGVAPGRVLPQLASVVDLLPTLLDLAGAAPDADLDGRSLRPLLAGASPVAPAWRSALVLESTSGNANLDIPGFVALRTPRFKWIEYANGARELYDLAEDPHELESREGPRTRALAEALSARLAALRRCAGEACRRIDGLAAPERGSASGG